MSAKKGAGANDSIGKQAGEGQQLMQNGRSSKPYDIIVFGDTCVDLILRDDDVVPQFGQVEKTVAGYDLVMGGSCCIFAAQAAKLGMSVAILGRVGADYFGKLIVDTLALAGVDTRFIEVDGDLRTGITVHLVQGDDRAMLPHMGSLNTLTVDDVTDEVLSSARHLHYGSLYLQTGLLPGWVDILERAKHLGLTVSLDTIGIPMNDGITTSTAPTHLWMCCCPMSRRRCTSAGKLPTLRRSPFYGNMCLCLS